MITGTTVAHLGDKHLRTINLLMPDSEMLDKAKKMLNPIFDLEMSLRIKNINLRKTSDLLLPKLISGQIDVENLDIDTGEIAA